MFSAQWQCSRNFKIWKVYAKAACSLVFFDIWKSLKIRGQCNQEQHLVLKYGSGNELLNTHISVSTKNIL